MSLGSYSYGSSEQTAYTAARDEFFKNLAGLFNPNVIPEPEMERLKDWFDEVMSAVVDLHEADKRREQIDREHY